MKPRRWLESIGMFFFRWWQLMCVVLFLLIILAGYLVRVVAISSVHELKSVNAQFETSAQRSVLSLASEGVSGYLADAEQGQFRWLIVGTDEVIGSGRERVLTDTILLASYFPQEAVVRLTSFPRDVYVPEYDRKINTLYELGLEESPRQPAQYLESTIETMLGSEIDNVVIVRLHEVERLIDIVGGVEVDVPRSFEDERYPRSGVDVRFETDPAVLYETVRFEEGIQQMDGETAIKYMRTRKSYDPTEGSDVARSRRQQQVIQAVAAKLQDPQVMAQPEVLGQLYRLYADSYAQSISLYNFGQLVRAFGDSRQIPVFESIELPVTDESQPIEGETLFVHPPLSRYDGQWVYERVGRDWSKVQQFAQQQGL